MINPSKIEDKSVNNKFEQVTSKWEYHCRCSWMRSSCNRSCRHCTSPTANNFDSTESNMKLNEQWTRTISWSFSIHQTIFRNIVYFYSNIIIIINYYYYYYLLLLLLLFIIIINQSVDLFQSIKLLSEILFTSTLILLLLIIIYYYYYYESISWSFSIHQTIFRNIVYFYSNITIIINYYYCYYYYLLLLLLLLWINQLIFFNPSNYFQKYCLLLL